MAGLVTLLITGLVTLGNTLSLLNVKTTTVSTILVIGWHYSMAHTSNPGTML